MSIKILYLQKNILDFCSEGITIFKFDVLWMYSDYCYYDEDEIPRLRDNAAKEIKDSYEHYKEQKWKLLERDKVKKKENAS